MVCLFYCYGFSLFHHKRYFYKKRKVPSTKLSHHKNSFTEWNIQKFIPNLILKIRTNKQQRNVKILTFTRKILIELLYGFLDNIRYTFHKFSVKHSFQPMVNPSTRFFHLPVAQTKLIAKRAKHQYPAWRFVRLCLDYISFAYYSTHILISYSQNTFIAYHHCTF